MALQVLPGLKGYIALVPLLEKNPQVIQIHEQVHTDNGTVRSE